MSDLEQSKCSYCGKSPPKFDTECVQTGEKLSFCGLLCRNRWAYEKEQELEKMAAPEMIKGLQT